MTTDNLYATKKGKGRRCRRCALDLNRLSEKRHIEKKNAYRRKRRRAQREARQIAAG
jgi:hypothetical protein